MSQYIELCVDYDDATKTYFKRKFLMVDEVPIAGEGNALTVEPVQLDPSERPREPLNAYVVTTFDEAAYDTDKKSKHGDVKVTDYYRDEYIAITQERDMLMTLIRSGDPVLIVDDYGILEWEDFVYELEYDRLYRNNAVSNMIEGSIEEIGKQEFFNRFRVAHYELYGEDITESLYLHSAEAYWQNLDKEQRNAFNRVWIENKQVFDRYLQSKQQNMER